MLQLTVQITESELGFCLAFFRQPGVEVIDSVVVSDERNSIVLRRKKRVEKTSEDLLR